MQASSLSWVVGGGALILLAGCGADAVKPGEHESAVLSAPALSAAATAPPSTSAPIATGGGSSATALFAGDDGTCAILEGGAVRCWGWDVNHTSTDEPRPPTAPKGLGTARQVAVGHEFACAVNSDKTVSCWGSGPAKCTGRCNYSDAAHDAERVVGLSGIEAVAAGHDHACALSGDGTVRCWGKNEYGVLGDHKAEDSPQDPRLVAGLHDIASITAGVNSTCAIDHAGAAFCWGRVAHGKDGPIRVLPGAKVRSITVGDQYYCGLVGDVVSCAGNDSFGELGDGARTERLAPAEVPGLKGVRELGGGGMHVCALLEDGSVFCWGTHILDGARLKAIQKPTRVAGLPTAQHLAVGRRHDCAMTESGVYCWGLGIANPDAYSRSQPVAVHIDGTKGMGVGTAFACAIRANGKIACWGSQYGLWDEGEIRTNAPVDMPAVDAVDELAVGGSHVCALRGGRLWCWGDGRGQIGPDLTKDILSPTEVHLPFAPDRVTAGASSTCFWSKSHSPQCWTMAEDAWLNTGASALSHPRQIAMSHKHACAITSDGGASCWGEGGHGQLGDGTTSDRPKPTAVTGLSHVAEIATGSTHSCAVLEDKSLVCWGYNASGELGLGDTKSVLTPTRVTGLENVEHVAATDSTTCAVAKGGIWCWGGDRRLTGVDKDVLQPRLIASTENVRQLSLSSSNHACALLADGHIQCWGRTESGELGDGTTWTPMPIRWN